MEHKFFTLKEVKLNNHCPECYSNDGLELTFKQKFVENVLYKAITEDTTKAMYCNTCDTEIFPVRWTDEIERVVEYQTRAATPKPKSLKLKPLAWIIIILDVILITGIVLFATGVLG